MEVLDIIEHEDGSATYQFDMTAEENEAMVRNGILWAIVCGCTGLTLEQAMKNYLNDEEHTMTNTRFDLSTLGLEKFMDVIHITSYIIQDTGLIMTGTRFDGGVIGFGIRGSQEDYISYNLQHDLLFLNQDTLTSTQYRAGLGIASLFDLEVKDFADD